MSYQIKNSECPEAGETYRGNKENLPKGICSDSNSGIYVIPNNPDESSQPHFRLLSAAPGDKIKVKNNLCDIISTGIRSNFSQEGLYRLGIKMDNKLTASLFIDRDPYLLEIDKRCVKAISPNDVKLIG